MLTRFWEKQLIHDDVVGINLVRRQFLHQALSLVERQEL